MESGNVKAFKDVYSLRDTFTSIFSPRQYITKEAALKRRKKNTEQTILKPGVRIHIRMGYGSDAAGLPVVFNGKIAEIDVGDVVTVESPNGSYDIEIIEIKYFYESFIKKRSIYQP